MTAHVASQRGPTRKQDDFLKLMDISSQAIFIRFDRIHERDRRTDGRTPRDGINRYISETIEDRHSYDERLIRSYI